MHVALRSETRGATVPQRVRALGVHSPQLPVPQPATPVSERRIDSAAIVVPLAARLMRPPGAPQPAWAGVSSGQAAQRAAVLLHMQRTQGNRAAHHYLERLEVIAVQQSPAPQPTGALAQRCTSCPAMHRS